jgi:dephospho-CoA kinase
MITSKNTPYFFAITGTSGSGKSYVLKKLQELNTNSSHKIHIIDADKLARDVLSPGSDALGLVRSSFGDEVFNSDGSLNRVKLGEIIFSNPSLKGSLEAITHPLIRSKFDTLLNSINFDPSKINLVFYDIPLFFEVNYHHPQCLGVIVVYSRRSTSIERIVKRDSISHELANKRLSNQINIEAKIQKADFVIDNEEPTEEYLNQQLESLVDWCKEKI